MSNIPENLRYAKSHEWAKIEEGVATVGITDYAQGSLGDITYVQLPKVGATVKAGEVFGVVESVKAASDIYAPVSGTVVSANAALEASPDLLNREPFAGGWIARLKVADAGEAAALLDAEGYRKATA